MLYRNTSVEGVIFQRKDDRLERRPQFVPNHLRRILMNHPTVDRPSLGRLEHVNQQQPEPYGDVSLVYVCSAHILAAETPLHVVTEGELEIADEE